MSTIKVDTIATRTGSGNITLSNNVASLTSAGAISGTNLSASGTLAVTGNATMGGTAAITGNTTVGGTLVNTGLITASAGVAIGGTGSANTLDDFEEGTFTAVRRTFQNDTAAWYGNEANLTNMSGVTSRYTKIGKIVHFYIPRQNVPTNNCTLYRITGLPFTALNDGNGDGTARFPVYYEEHRGFHGRYNNDKYTNNYQMFYYTYGNATEIIPGCTLENSDGSLYPFAATSSGSAFPAVIGMYETAS